MWKCELDWTWFNAMLVTTAGGKYLKILMVAATVLKKQSPVADKGWSSSFVFGCGVTQHLTVRRYVLRNFYRCFGIESSSWQMANFVPLASATTVFVYLMALSQLHSLYCVEWKEVLGSEFESMWKWLCSILRCWPDILLRGLRKTKNVSISDH
jgi:hypothetical protein